MLAFVEGLGLVGPGLRGWQASRAILAGKQAYCPAPTAVAASDLLPAAERRRTGLPVKLALAAGQEAFAGAGRNAAATATVFTSSSGDGDNLHQICEALAAPERQISPRPGTGALRRNAARPRPACAVTTRASQRACWKPRPRSRSPARRWGSSPTITRIPSL